MSCALDEQLCFRCADDAADQRLGGDRIKALFTCGACVFSSWHEAAEPGRQLYGRDRGQAGHDANSSIRSRFRS
jgi:hypothetical protein